MLNILFIIILQWIYNIQLCLSQQKIIQVERERYIQPETDIYKDLQYNAVYTPSGKALYQQSTQYEDQIAESKYLEKFSRLGSCAFNKLLIIDTHNQLRQKHNETQIQWNKLLQSRAQMKADTIAEKGCKILNLPKEQAGDLVAINGGTSYQEEEVVEHFYQGVWGWDFNNTRLLNMEEPYNFQDFMQIIWSNTTDVGCGKGCCEDGEVWVCSYFPIADLNSTHIHENVLPFTDGYKDAIAR